MNLEALRLARRLFDEVVECAPEDHDRLLRSSTDDEAVVRYVLELLAEDRCAAGVLTGVTSGAVLGAVTTSVQYELPSRFSGFEITRRIGQGGMGVVYEAEQDIPRRTVALKTMRSAVHATGAALRREVHALGRLDHPNIPTVHALVEVEGVPVLVMEFVQGTPLLEAADGRSHTERVTWLTQVCDAVEHAHERGVIHRDLKPGNVLLTVDGWPKVLDFGIAALASSDALAAGTPGFAAPEQTAGAPADVRADVYGLGRLGQALLPDADRTIAAILDHATRSDPAHRLPTAHALADELRRYMALEPVRSLPLAPHESTVLWLRRHRRRLAWMGVVALGAVVTSLLADQTLAWWDVRQRSHGADQALFQLQQDAATLGVDHPLVQAAFTALVHDARHEQTPAVSEAWRWHARHGNDARKDLVLAWASAPDPRTQELALRDLAEVLVDQRDWRALHTLVQDLPPSALPDVRTTLAIATRDIPSALRHADVHLRPFLERWLSARDMPRGVGTFDGNTLIIDHADSTQRVGVDGAIAQTWPTPDDMRMHFVRVEGDRVWRFGRVKPGGNGHRLELLEADGVRVVTEDMWSIVDLVVGDMDGDTIFERYDALSPGPVTIAVPPDTDHDDAHLGGDLTATVEVVEILPLGRPEPLLVVGTVGWESRGLRLYTHDGDGLRLLSRLRVAPQTVAEVPDAEGEPTLVVLGRAHDALPGGWGPDLHEGALLVRTRLLGEELRIVGTQPLPMLPDHSVTGDVNDDGLVDLVAWNRFDGMVALQRPGGDYLVQLLPGLRPTAIGQADGDPELELWLTTREADGSWLLGVPDGSPISVALPAGPDALREFPASLDPDARAWWNRAERLLSLGLQQDAADMFEALGARLDDVGRLALFRALELRDNPEAAARIARALAGRAGLSNVDRQPIADALWAAHDVDSLSALGDPRAFAVKHDLLAADTGWEQRSDLATRRRADGRVQLRATSRIGPLLQMPVRLEEAVDLRLELDRTHHAWSTGIALQLSAGEWTATALLERRSREASTEHDLVLTCTTPGHQPIEDRVPFRLGEGVLRLSIIDGVARCGFEEMALYRPAEPPQQATLGILTQASHVYSKPIRGELVALRVAGVTPTSAEGEIRRAFPPLHDLHTRSDAELVLLLREHPQSTGVVRAAAPDRFARLMVEAWTSSEDPPLPLLSPDLDDVPFDTRYGWLIHCERAVAMREMGALQQAEGLLEQLVEGPYPFLGWREMLYLRIEQGDLPAAKEALEQWRAHHDPVRVDDRLLDDPLLAPLRGALAVPTVTAP